MYESYYHFTDKPFRLSPDPRYFFSSQSHKRALSYLLYGLRQGDGFIIITGDVGTGKSTLLGALAVALKDQNFVVAKIVSTQIEAEDLLRTVAAGFGVSSESDTKASLLIKLESFFRDCMHQGRRALLLIDEAQNLPLRSVEELRMLSNFQIGNKPLLQTFLLGQREFRNIMRSGEFEQLRQRVIAAYHLRPLDPAETRSYIEHRLNFVGWNQDPVLADDIFLEIYQATEGIPRRINVLCDRLLLFGSIEELHYLDRDVVKTVIGELQEEEICPDPERDFSSTQPLEKGPEAASQFSASLNNNLEKRIGAVEATLDSVQHELISTHRAILELRDLMTARGALDILGAKTSPLEKVG